MKLQVAKPQDGITLIRAQSNVGRKRMQRRRNQIGHTRVLGKS